MPLNFSTGLTGSIGLADLPSAARVKSNFTPAAGVDLGSWEQDINNAADELIAVPSDVSGLRALEVWNLDATDSVQIGSATGGSFATSVFSEVKPGFPMLFYPSVSMYAKATGAAPIKVAFRVAEIS
jgi:hypothetical protein